MTDWYAIPKDQRLAHYEAVKRARRGGPAERSAVPWNAKLRGVSVHVSVEHDDRFQPLALKVEFGKEGNPPGAVARLVATAVTKLLEVGAPLEELHALRDFRDELAGPTSDPLVPHAKSFGHYLLTAIPAHLESAAKRHKEAVERAAGASGAVA